MNCVEEKSVFGGHDQLPVRPRIFVDCTQTLKTPVSTGIPRVVRNIVKHGRPAARQRGSELIPVRFEHGHFVAAETGPDDELSCVNQRNATHNRLHPVLNRLRKLLVPRTLVRFFQKQARAIFPGRGMPVSISAGDILLLPDSSWTEKMWDAVDAAIAEGASLGVIQHDFIPLRHPDLVPAASTAIFSQWVNQTLRRAHFIMAVSKTVAAETRQELVELGRCDIAENFVSAFRNGADLPAPSSCGPIRRELIEFMGPPGKGPYLNVGTIEPRKNQATLLSAITDVLSSAPDARFLFAGLVGWAGRPIVESLKQHAAYPQNIRHFPDLNDTELRFAYANAKAVVFPSLAEGYGLPIVESLANGTCVFASDIPVHREIGEPYCVFFDPLNASNLASLLIAHSLHGDYSASWPPAHYDLPGWREAVEAIVETSLAFSAQLMNFNRPNPAPTCTTKTQEFD